MTIIAVKCKNCDTFGTAEEMLANDGFCDKCRPPVKELTMHRAILINPHMQTVCEVFIEPTIDGMYYALGKTDAMFSGMVECVNLGQRPTRGVDAWIDEEGALSEGRPVFSIAGKVFFAGCALLIDNDGEGNTVGTKLPLSVVESMVEWTGLETTGDFGPGREYEAEHPIFGKSSVIEGGKPIYRERAGL